MIKNQVFVRKPLTTPITTLDEYTLQPRNKILVALREGRNHAGFALCAVLRAPGQPEDFIALGSDGGVGALPVGSAGQQNDIVLRHQLVSAALHFVHWRESREMW